MYTRKIIHIDMDCFYAAVELKRHPELKGKPLAIGGREGRSVLCTANYEARKFGVRAAMPSSIALRKCPHLELIHPDMAHYKQESQKIFEILKSYSPLFQPLSLDEAFLDVSKSQVHSGSATLIAQEIRERIQKECGLTASAGVAPNKFLAKIASDRNKPNGLCVVRPADIPEFMKTVKIEDIWGVGVKTAERMHKLGYFDCIDLQKSSPGLLEKQFGKFGKPLWDLAHGRDFRPVDPTRDRKSFSKEHTFEIDYPAPEAAHYLEKIYQSLVQSFERWKHTHPGHSILGLEVKVRFEDFFTTSVSQRGLPRWSTVCDLYSRALERHEGKIRLLGVGFHLNQDILDLQTRLDFGVY